MPDETAQLTVHVVDDDANVLHSTAFLLRAAGYRTETYQSGKALLDRVGTLAAGCVLTDVRMPDIDGLELQARLAAARPDLAVIIMTGHGDVPMAVGAMRAGATHFLEKPFANEALLSAVKDAISRAERAQTAHAAVSEIADRMRFLTPREREVMLLMAEGQTNKDIGRKLGISPRTVEMHRAMVLGKMQAPNLAALVRMVLTAERAEVT